jgi:putative glutamine amidotransferase
MRLSRPPLVWVVASHRHLYNTQREQCYTVMDEVGTRTLVNMGLQPVCYPRVPPERIPAMLDTVDGILLGGSDTNVHPHLYGEEPFTPEMLLDECRDAVAQPLIRLAVERGVPLIAFCRGCHDFNVAMGGSLHQCLKHLRHSIKHWENEGETIDQDYDERHLVSCTPGGELEQIAGQRRFAVSSLHLQGVKRLGKGLVAEATADDGLVKASSPGASSSTPSGAGAAIRCTAASCRRMSTRATPTSADISPRSKSPCRPPSADGRVTRRTHRCAHQRGRRAFAGRGVRPLLACARQCRR